MATIQSIQRHPALLLSVLGGGLILMIIMFGFDDFQGFGQSGRDTVLDVNGNPVSWAQYETERQHQSDFIQQFYGQDVNKPEISHQLNNQVYSQFVQELVYDKQLKEVGINVCDAEVNELAQGNHISPVLTQIFGENAQVYGQQFAQLVSTNGFEEFQQQYNAPFMTLNNWLVIENQIKNTRKLQKYNALLAAALKPNKLEAQDIYNGENTDVAFTYVRKRAMEVADSLVKVSDSDVKAYYEEHKANFKQQQQTRNIAYIAVPLHPSQADCDNVLANLQKAMPDFTQGEVKEVISTNSVIPFIDAYMNDNTFRGELKEFVNANAAGAISEPAIYNGDILSMLGETSENDESLSQYYWMARIMGKQNAPDSIKLVIAGAPTVEAQDSLFQEIKKGSQDSVASWITNLAMANYEEGLRDKIAAAKVGDTFKYDFKNGQQQVYVAAKVIEKTKNVPQTKVAIYAEKISPSSKTRRAEYGRLNEFVNDFQTIQVMQDSALDHGFHMYDATIASSSYNINNVRECRSAVRFAFDGKVGQVSEIFEEGNYLIVVGIKGEIEEGYASLQDAQLKNYIRMQVMPEKKVAYLAANDFKNVADKSLEGYASALGVEAQEATRVNFTMNSISGLGVEPKVIGEALKNAEGTVVGPIEGNNNVVVLKVGAKTNKGLTFNEEEYKSKVSNGVYRNAAAYANQTLIGQAEIKDNRIKFY